MISRILIVEPNPKLAGHIQYTLNYEDIETEVASSCASCLSSISNHSPNVVVLDNTTSDMDSERVYQLIKNNPVTMHAPIIVLDEPSQFDSTNKNISLDIGDYHLQKNSFVPFCLVELLRCWGYIGNTTPDLQPSEYFNKPRQETKESLERVYGV